MATTSASLESYLWTVVNSSTTPRESKTDRLKRYARMRSICSNGHAGKMLPRLEWLRLRLLSGTWTEWKVEVASRVASSHVLGRWFRRLLKNRTRAVEAQAPQPQPRPQRQPRRRRRRKIAGIAKHNSEELNPAEDEDGDLLPDMPTLNSDGVVEEKEEGEQQQQQVSAATMEMVQKWIGLALAQKLRPGGGGISLGDSPPTTTFAFSTPWLWQDMVSDFLKQTMSAEGEGCVWGGKVAPGQVLHELFYVLNSNLGTDLIVKALISETVTLQEMQSGRVWLRAKTPWDRVEKMSIRLVRMHGSGMVPDVQIGSRGILRVPLTVCFKGCWSHPVWINVGALPFVKTYEDHLKLWLLSPASRKLSSCLRDLRPPATVNTNVMLKLTPLMSTLTRSDDDCATRDWRFRCLTDAVFETRWRRWTWWSFWRQEHLQELQLQQLCVLRFIFFTKVGTELLFKALMCWDVEDVFRGKRYLFVDSIDEADDVRTLRFATGVSAVGVPRSTHANTLGGMGPCCVAICVAQDTFVWLNVATLRYAACNGRWTAGVYRFLFKHAMTLLRAVRGWAMWHVGRKIDSQ